MKNNNLYNSPRVRSLGSAIFLIAIFALAAFSARAQIVDTTVSASEPDGATKALISVFDAETGRQIANGLTDAETGQFTFKSAIEQSFVVVALVESETIYATYLGSARGAAGSSISVSANQEQYANSVCYVSENVALSYSNANGLPLKNARISIVDSNTSANVRRGKTDQQGQYNFNIPADLYGEGFLAVVWKGNGAINLKRITPGCFE